MNLAPHTERALVFACEGESLLGVLSEAPHPARLGALIVVGGPQYRAGSHRHFVRLARALAAQGMATLRFDVRGMGDSGGAMRDFQAIEADIDAALGALGRAQPSLQRVVLIGLCDAASAALMYVQARPHDRRVAGLVLMNPWARSQATLAKTHVRHYYLRRLREREFWAKLLRGGIAWQALRALARNLALAFAASPAQPEASRDFRQRMAEAWATTPARLWLVLSGDDYTAREFRDAFDAEPLWRAARERAGVRRFDLAEADHTFSSAEQQSHLSGWLIDELRAFETSMPACPAPTRDIAPSVP